jgi:hypothetical protein
VQFYLLPSAIPISGDYISSAVTSGSSALGDRRGGRGSRIAWKFTGPCWLGQRLVCRPGGGVFTPTISLLRMRTGRRIDEVDDFGRYERTTR